MNKGRLEAFADGVYAFAITLLVLGFTLPIVRGPHAEADLLHALLRMWPNLIAYLLSFAVIGIMWQNHQTYFRIVRTVDRTTVFLNLGLLAATVFIPFATSVLGAYPTMRPSTFLYGLTLTICATFFNLIPMHVTRAGNLMPEVTEKTIKENALAYRIGWATYAIATLVALVVPVASFLLYIAIAAYYLVPQGADRDLPEPQ